MPVRDALAAVADRAAARHVPVALACHDVGVEDVGVEDVGVGLGVGAEEGVQAGGDGSNRSELSGNQERESDRAGPSGSNTSSDSSSLGRLVVRPSTFVARLSEEDRAVPRYFVPDLPAEVDLCGGSRADGVAVPVVGATNLGMWCNDRAFEASAELGDEAACKLLEIGHRCDFCFVLFNCARGAAAAKPSNPPFRASLRAFFERSLNMFDPVLTPFPNNLAPR